MFDIHNPAIFQGHQNCHYPLIFDTYHGKCPLKCSYCYTEQKRGTEENFSPVDLSKISSELYTAFETDKSTKYSSVFRKKIPIRIGGFVECFSALENKEKNSLRLLKLLKKYNYPVVIITKSELISSDEYLEQLNPNSSSIQISIPYFKERYRELIEPSTPTLQTRINTVETLIKSGFFVSARINPLFPIFKDQQLSEQIYSPLENLDIFSLELIDILSEIHIPNIIAGFVHLNQKQLIAISKKIGIDLSSYMTLENKIKQNGFMYSPDELVSYIQYIKQYCLARNISFSPCYLGQKESIYNELSTCFCDVNDCCNISSNIADIDSKNCLSISEKLFLSLESNKEKTFIKSLTRFIIKHANN